MLCWRKKASTELGFRITPIQVEYRRKELGIVKTRTIRKGNNGYTTTTMRIEKAFEVLLNALRTGGWFDEAEEARLKHVIKDALLRDDQKTDEQPATVASRPPLVTIQRHVAA